MAILNCIIPAVNYKYNELIYIHLMYLLYNYIGIWMWFCINSLSQYLSFWYTQVGHVSNSACLQFMTVVSKLLHVKRYKRSAMYIYHLPRIFLNFKYPVDAVRLYHFLFRDFAGTVKVILISKCAEQLMLTRRCCSYGSQPVTKNNSHKHNKDNSSEWWMHQILLQEWHVNMKMRGWVWYNVTCIFQ